MPLGFIRHLDRWMGMFLILALAFPARMALRLSRNSARPRRRHVFVKLKGGGSLIIAMPSLLGVRRRHQQDEMVLVCTREAKIYGELCGVFDRYILVEDQSLPLLILSGLRALRQSMRADSCVDLEPNSLLAAVFTMLTCSRQRIGFVSADFLSRALAYTNAIQFNAMFPIHTYYDKVAELFGADNASDADCVQQMRTLLPPARLAPVDMKTVAVAPFTSDFARERMMHEQVWAELILREFKDAPVRIILLGSHRHTVLATHLETALMAQMQKCQVVNLCGKSDLATAAATMAVCEEVWAVDSGLLHIARMLGVKTQSFWGPTAPPQRLRPSTSLEEVIHYRGFLCSPCIPASGSPPCRGNNLCMQTMAASSPDLAPVWTRRC